MVPNFCSAPECDQPHKVRGYCMPHYRKLRIYETPCTAWPTTPLAERLWARVDVRSSSECWPWTGPVTKAGYGLIGRGRRAEGISPVHRVAYELSVGPIAEGLQVDHTCHNDTSCVGGDGCEHRRCCNPNHLEAVPLQVNVARGNAGIYQTFKTHCPKGHEYTPENTFRNSGGRGCKVCRREWNRKYNAKRKAASNGK